MPRTAAATPFDSYLSDINRSPLLSCAEERDLAARILGGDAVARDRLVRANLRLVVNIARGYRNKGLDIEDLVSSGNMGLLRAVEGFDADMNTRFSTYASYWIKESIRRGIVNTAKTIRVPAYLVQLVGDWGRTGQALADQLGRPATLAEVAERLGLSARRAGRVADAVRSGRTGRVADAVRSGRTRSIAVADEDGPGDPIADGKADEPGAALQATADLARLGDLLGRLNPRDATVLRMRYGLGGQPSMTLKDIGMEIGLTRERVRQIEANALTRLNECFEPVSKEVERPAPP